MGIRENLFHQLSEQGAQPILETDLRLFSPAILWIKEWQDYWLDLPSIDRLCMGEREFLPQHGNWFMSQEKQEFERAAGDYLEFKNIAIK